MHFDDPDETTPGSSPELRISAQAGHVVSRNRQADDDDEPAFWLEAAQERLFPALTRFTA